MPYANGRLPASALAPVPGGQFAREAAAAWNAMGAEARRRGLAVPRPLGGQSSYRSLVGQQYFWGLYISGRGNLAARPGTSNHGWGRACDLASPAMRHTVNTIGAAYGWRKVEAPSEWWHVNCVGGYHAAPPPDALAPLTPTERRWVREYRRLKTAGQNRPRRAVLRLALTRARKRAWRAMKKRPSETTRQRYALLARATN